nr:PREDICTED: uncharacterized protein LOC105669020 [Linepithema humile]
MSHASSAESETLTSGSILRSLLLEKKHYNTNNEKIMAISSAIHISSNGKKAALTVQDNYAQFSLPNTLSVKCASNSVSANTNVSKDYLQSYTSSRISTNVIQKVERVFLKWKVMLNNQHELIIKGTLACGKIAHSKPISRRYTATCIESKFKYKYHPEGTIVDETNDLLNYVPGKFYNGFPDDWKNVYLLWRTYVNQGCPITFHWLTPITDSDDDLKSEMTDLSYTSVNNDKVVPRTKFHRLAERIKEDTLDTNYLNSPLNINILFFSIAEKLHTASLYQEDTPQRGCPITFHWLTPITDSDDDSKSEMTDLRYTCVNNDEVVPRTKSHRLAERIQSEYSSNKFPKKKEKYNNCLKYSSQNYEKNTLFIKPLIPESKNKAPVSQTSLAYDEDGEQNFRPNVNTSHSSRKMTILKDYIQKDKPNIIINNLIDKNCSRAYIDKIVEMCDCLNYVASYEALSECIHSPMVLARQHTFKSEQTSPQQTAMLDSNCVDTNKIGNRTMEPKSYVHSSDLGYKSVKNDFITAHQSNPISTKPERNDYKNLDKSESEIYSGIPKIQIERVLRHRERMHNGQVEKKIMPQKYAANSQHNARGVGSESVRTTIPIVSAKETLFSEPCTSTHDEATNAGRRRKAVVHQRPHKTTFLINQEAQRRLRSSSTDSEVEKLRSLHKITVCASRSRKFIQMRTS